MFAHPQIGATIDGEQAEQLVEQLPPEWRAWTPDADPAMSAARFRQAFLLATVPAIISGLVLWILLRRR